MTADPARAALVTGGARGIGRAAAERLAAERTRVMLLDLDADRVEATAHELSALGAEVGWMGGDVTREEDVVTAVADCVDRFGRLDVLVAAAGIAPARPLLELSDADWQRTLDVNLTGAFRCMRDAARVMADGAGGSIVLLSSTNAFHVEEHLAAYNTSKGGLVALVRSAAMDLARHGIRVNAVAPGVVRTRVATWVTEDEAMAARYLKTIPLGRFGEPSDVADAVLFLASDRAGYVTGQTLVLDGGQTLGIPADTGALPVESSEGGGEADA